MTIYGLDEAGRGPVLGSMFIGVVAIEDQSELGTAIDDSKKLSEKQRKEILTVHSGVRKTTIEVTSSQIDSDTNLSTLTIQAMGTALQELGASQDLTDEDLIFADACLPDEQKFVSQLAGATGISTENIIGTHEADEKYPVVGLASIVAKQAREDHITQLQQKYSQYTIGSGYPSDTTTRSFLKQYYTENLQFPPETRTSWSTCEDLVPDK